MADSQACMVIPLCRVERDQLYLSAEAARWAIDELLVSLEIAMPPKHRALFVARRYRAVSEVRKVLMRYKVFGDLGYGGK